MGIYHPKFGCLPTSLDVPQFCLLVYVTPSNHRYTVGLGINQLNYGFGTFLQLKSKTTRNAGRIWRQQYDTGVSKRDAPEFMELLPSGQRKLGSYTSMLRTMTNRIVRLDIDEGRCETEHHITIHHKRITGYDRAV